MQPYCLLEVVIYSQQMKKKVLHLFSLKTLKLNFRSRFDFLFRCKQHDTLVEVNVHPFYIRIWKQNCQILFLPRNIALYLCSERKALNRLFCSLLLFCVQEFSTQKCDCKLLYFNNIFSKKNKAFLAKYRRSAVL